MILRFAYVAVLFVMLSSCGDNVSAFANVARDLLAENEKDPLYGKRLAGINPETLENLGFSVIYADLPSIQKASFMRPMERNANVETWVSTQGTSLSMADGIIVATRGYGYDLASSKRPTLSELQQNAKTKESYESAYRHWDLEGNLRTRVGLCKAARIANQIQEQCSINGLKVTNSYELGPQGITTSLQWISPERGYLKTIRLK